MSKNVNQGKKPRINPKKQLAIAHLSSGKTISESAKLIGVTRQTINNWMKDPEFESNYERALEKLTIYMSDLYFVAEEKAFRTIFSIMQNTSASNSERIRAAIEIQKHSQSFRNYFLLQKQIEKLEGRGSKMSKFENSSIQLEFPDPLSFSNNHLSKEEMDQLDAELDDPDDS